MNKPCTSKMFLAAGVVVFGMGSFGPFAGVAAADDDGSRNLPASSYPAGPSHPADSTWPAPPDWGTWDFPYD